MQNFIIEQYLSISKVSIPLAYLNNTILLSKVEWQVGLKKKCILGIRNWTVPMSSTSDWSGTMISSSWSSSWKSKGLQLAFEGQSQTELVGLKWVPGPQDWMIGLPFQQFANLVQSPGTGLSPE